MKNNLGEMLFILLIVSLSFSIIDAQENEYSWDAYINKKTAYVNEAVYLKYTCTFKDRSELYVIEFNPKSNEDYEIISLSQSEHIHNYKRINTYEYIVFAKKAGSIDFDFDVRMKKTNKDSIENTVLGRDNAQFEEFSIKVLKQKRLHIDIKDMKQKLVGNFTLEIKKDIPKVKAYEPYHLNITIKGLGDLENLSDIEFNGVDAKVFASKAQKKYILTKDGYRGTWSQKFAFVASKDFKIPSFQMEYFDTNDAKVKTLQMKDIDVKVTPSYTKKELLDDIDDNSFEFKSEYLYYILSFIAGYLFAKLNFKRIEKKTNNINSFERKVKNTKTLEELHMLLILQNTSKYKNIIARIDKGEISSLNEAKKGIEYE